MNYTITVSARVTSKISKQAKANLFKQGITISEYLRLALIKAANNDIQGINSTDSPEAIVTKKGLT